MREFKELLSNLLRLIIFFLSLSRIILLNHEQKYKQISCFSEKI